MSTGVQYGDTLTRPVTMDSDLSDSKEGYAVNLDTTDEGNVDIAADASAFPFPLMEGGDGSSSKYLGLIAYGGRCKVKLGGTVASGDKLTSNASGVWIATTTDTDHYGAVAAEVGASGDLIEVFVERGMVAG